jgi:hypothetical protein
VYVQDICAIVSHIISRAQHTQQQQQQSMAASDALSSSSCVLAGLPHCIYNMVRQGSGAAVGAGQGLVPLRVGFFAYAALAQLRGAFVNRHLAWALYFSCSASQGCTASEGLYCLLLAGRT